MLAAIVVMSAIRAPHVRRSLAVPVASSREGLLDRTLVVLVLLSLLASIVWVATPWLGFADRGLHPVPFALGTLSFVAGLWLLHRSHADLSTNWSNTLELRQDHRLVTDGVYRRLRHPMYTALLLYAVAQALVLPNWIAGPSALFAFSVLVALRLRREERMMADAFGPAYAAYAARTKRLVPGMW